MLNKTCIIQSKIITFLQEVYFILLDNMALHNNLKNRRENKSEL